MIPKSLVNLAPFAFDHSYEPPPSVEGTPSYLLGTERGTETGWSMDDARGSVRGFGEVALRLFDFKLRDINVKLFEYSVMIEVESEVPDRDTGAPLVITFRQDWPRSFWEGGPEKQAEAIRQTLRRWMNHELDEQIYISGRRHFDPHAREQRAGILTGDIK